VQLDKLKENHKCIIDIRGLGLMIGVELAAPISEVIQRCQKKGILVGPAGEKTLRLTPPLIVTQPDIDRLIEVLELKQILTMATVLKSERQPRQPRLAGKSLAMIFEKASTRTRVSFEVGMYQLGGQAIFLSRHDSQLGRGEPIEDTARVLSRYVDGIMIRTFSQDDTVVLSRYATVPVINGLTDLLHPSQVLSDVFTIQERFGDIRKLKVAYVGDGNNMANSWINAAMRFGFDLQLACPDGYHPDAKILARVFAPYQVNDQLLAVAAPDVMVLHCLPAHRGEEITAPVFSRFQEFIFSQAENRMHVQKALLATLLGGAK